MAVAIWDGHYLLHRVMHVPQLRMLSTKDNKPSGAVFGFIKSLRSTIQFFPEIRRVVAVFDGGHSTRRKSLFGGYKNREKNEEVDPDGLSYIQKFSMQLNYLKFILPRLGIKVVSMSGREGDDVIGLLTRKPDEVLKIVVSDDRDMYQLVTENVHVWRPIAEERVFLKNFEEVVGCKKEHWLLRKALLGDSSDTIPGIRGVGGKTIDKLIEELNGEIGPYPHEDLFMYALDHESKKIRAIGENFDLVVRNFKLLDIRMEEFSEEEYENAIAECDKESKFDVLAVRRLFTSLEFYSLIENFAQWVTPFQLLR